MADLSSQIDEARSSGYSDPDIVQYLGSSRADLAPKLKEAQTSGYQPGEILDYLKASPPPESQPQQQPAQPVAAQPAPGLPHPDLVAQQTTTHAATLARIVLKQQPPPPNPDEINARQLQGQVDAPNTPALPGWADRPLIPDVSSSVGPEGGPVAQGIARGLTSFASGMTTPKNLGLLAGTWGLGDSVVALRSLGRLVSAGFSVDMMWQAAKKAPQLVQQIRKGDTAGASETITSMGLGLGMAGMSAMHAAKGTPKAAAPEASANSTGSEPYKPPAQAPSQPVAAPAAQPVDYNQHPPAVPAIPAGFEIEKPAEAFRDAFGAEKPEAKPADKPGPPPPAAGAERVKAPNRGNQGGREGEAQPPSSQFSTDNADKPADRPQDRGPVTLGMGLGAFEPFLRESIEDMRALKATRDAALEELKRSEITPGQKRWGEQVRHYFTGERDLWAARANQGIAKVRKLTFPSRNRRTGVDTLAEAIAIAREFKGKPDELRSILGGYHPDLARLAERDPQALDRVMPRIQALRPQIERALQPMDAGMKAADQFYTNMAEMTGQEGKRVGVLHTEWNPETYVPHSLNPKGEGAFPGVKKAVGRALGGDIGKYFGFAKERSYPTLLHAIMNDVIPKTMNVHDAFTIQQNGFARARATRLLEDLLRTSKLGTYTVRENAPEGSVPLAPASEEFVQKVPYDTGTIDEEGKAVLDIADKRLFVPKYIAEGLKAITAPDYTVEIGGKDIVRGFQAATKAAQLGLSFFHATTENYMALANMGPKGWARALMADRESPEFLLAERDFIAHGGTTSIQGNTVEAYRAMKPGSIPTYQDIWRQNAAVKIMDQAAHAITDFTFANMQRRFKVTDYQLHKAAWMEKNPGAMRGEAREAGRGIAKEVNAIYGGLHWENIGARKAGVEIARALMLAPDWTISNIFNVKYAFEDLGGFRRGLKSGRAGTTVSGKMARMFWVRTILGGIAGTQAASLMFTNGDVAGLAHRLREDPRRALTNVYMGHDVNGEEIWQNWFFKGAPGDAVNLANNTYEYGLLEGPVRTIAGKGAPLVRTGLELAQNQGFMGGKIAPKGMAWPASTARTAWAITKGVSPIPFSVANQVDMLFGPEAHKYTWPESLTTMFSGNPPSHVAPEGTVMRNGILRPKAEREENSTLDQAETGRVYRSRNGR